jgi:hypothetical protein
LEAKHGLVIGAFTKSELNHIYVALSRVRSWEKLYILPYLRLQERTLTAQKKEANFRRQKALKTEMSRLASLAKKTEQQFKSATK